MSARPREEDGEVFAMTLGLVPVVDVERIVELLRAISEVPDIRGAGVLERGVSRLPSSDRDVESGVVYGISGALWGEITLKNGRVEQSNFNNYRVLRMNETPPIEVHLVRNGEVGPRSAGGAGDGSYVLGERIGCGGLGEVCQATHW